MWMQIVGKIRLARMPWINHSWHVPLYVTARGLTTSAIPPGFQMDFDFIDHELIISASDGGVRSVALRPRSVADFYRELFSTLGEMGIDGIADSTEAAAELGDWGRRALEVSPGGRGAS